MRFRVSKISVWLGLSHIVGCMVLLSANSTDALYVLTPIVCAILICAWLVAISWKRDHVFPIIDIGVFCIIFSALYILIPLLNFYFGGLSFGALSDGRLQSRGPNAEDIGLFFVNHLVYLFALTSAYLVFRRPNIKQSPSGVLPPSRGLVTFVVAAYLSFTLYFLTLSLVYGIGYRAGYGEESAQLHSKGPLLLQQINGKLKGIHEILFASVLGLLILHKGNFKARFFLFLVIAWQLLASFIFPGSRGGLILLLLLTVLFWHKFHGIKLKRILISLGSIFVLFMFLGLYRSYGESVARELAVDFLPVLASASNEFQATLGTAYDVHLFMKAGDEVPLVLAFNDFTPLLPPQQLLPFSKISGANWYLQKIGFEGQGVGFSWGVISQALIGHGKLELVIRGIVLGWFLAAIHRWYQLRSEKFMPSVIYFSLFLGTILTFRDTTGAILWGMWWSLFPFVVILWSLGFRNSLSRSPVHRSG